MMSARLCALSTICARYCWRGVASSAGCCAMRASPSSAVQRRAELVAGVGQERALGPARRLGLVEGRASAWSIWRRSVMSSAIHSVPPSVGMRRLDGLAEQAAPEDTAVEAPHFALDLQRPGSGRPASPARLRAARAAMRRRAGQTIGRLPRSPTSCPGVAAEHPLPARVDLLEASRRARRRCRSRRSAGSLHARGARVRTR